MKNWWIRFGCFLTGHNYAIVRNSSEVAAKSVKRYTAAMVIVCILWAFIGYTFTNRYLQASYWGSIAGAIIAIVIIIQIERQIILSVNPSAGLYIFRALLAIMMAVLGAVIIDQIILKQDIELEKITYIQERVVKVLPSRSQELQKQIFALDTTIQSKETDRQNLIDAITKAPVIPFTTSQTQRIPMPVKQFDSTGKESTTIQYSNSTTISRHNIPNPKQFLIPTLDSTIAQMRSEKSAKEASLLNIRPALEDEIKKKTGFLDELEVMHRLLSKSLVAFFFWLLWILFFLLIEMLVLVSKMGDKGNDYEKTVKHHMTLQIRKLEALAKASEGEQYLS